MPNTPAHSMVHIEFDLFILGSWDGSRDPDIWNMNYITTSFANCYPGFVQSFPDYYPRGNYPAQAGSIEHNTLGYWNPNDPLDAVYHFSFTQPHPESLIQYTFWAETTGYNALWDESWGIDNVLIEINSVPEPSSLLVFGAGISILGMLKRRKK
jgi:hypothetical protein